jgi:hypothetical protein
MKIPANHPTKKVISILAGFILIGVLAGCVSSQLAVTKPVGPLAVHVNPLLIGTYTSSINADDAKKAGVEEDNAGNYELSLNADGKYELKHNNALATRGIYDVVEDRLTFQVQEICPTCRCPNDKGVYQWVSTGQGLQLTEEDDPCADLAMVYSAHPWKQK